MGDGFEGVVGGDKRALWESAISQVRQLEGGSLCIARAECIIIGI